jgi:hypothetical protein
MGRCALLKGPAKLRCPALYNHMNFSEWLEEQEMLTEGAAQGVIKGVQAYLSKFGTASKAEAMDLRNAFLIYRERLAHIFDKMNARPTPEQMEQARQALMGIPKLAAVILPLIAPVPGMFSTLMVLSIVAKRFFGVSILPKHFETAFLGPGSFLNRFVKN